MQSLAQSSPFINTGPRQVLRASALTPGGSNGRPVAGSAGALPGRASQFNCTDSASKDSRQAAGATTSSSRLSPAALQLGTVNFGAMAGNTRRQALRSPPQPDTSLIMKQDDQPHMLHVDPSVFDLSYWHYKPWWWQPPMIVGAGVAFVVVANILDEACMKTTILACCTVGVWWGVCLYALPRSFRSFATQYIDSHDFPEDQLQKQVQDVALCCVETEEQCSEAPHQAWTTEEGAGRQMATVQQERGK